MALQFKKYDSVKRASTARLALRESFDGHVSVIEVDSKGVEQGQIATFREGKLVLHRSRCLKGRYSTTNGRITVIEGFGGSPELVRPGDSCRGDD